MTSTTDPPEPAHESDDRYLSYEAMDGSVVVYDGENDDAWVQSDTTVEIER